MKNVLVLMIVGLLFSCVKKGQIAKEESEVQKPYVISEEDRKNQKYSDSVETSESEIKVFPLKGFYGECNLIIDRNGDVLYFQNKNDVRMCGTGMEYDTIPEYLDLQPKHLVKIPKDCIEKFVNENVMNKEKRRQILIMASQTDTIKNEKFLSFFYNMKVQAYIVRRTTQEEDTVLYYKKKDMFYDSKEIKWDKSRIKFTE